MLPAVLAQHFRAVFFGGNWTAVNLKTTLADVQWTEATTAVHNCNTIAALVFHIDYYVAGMLPVLQGGSLDIHDKFSFLLPTLSTEEDWQKLVQQTLAHAEAFAQGVEALPPEKLDAHFSDEKYGSFLRNLFGVTEHTHYHLGQIAVLKKIIREIKTSVSS